MAAVLLGTVAMSGIGLTLGYGLPPEAAIATANVVFLPMAFVGGLFLPPDLLPSWASATGWATSMRPWVELSFGIADGTGTAGWLWLALAAWAVVLVAVAAWAYRRGPHVTGGSTAGPRRGARVRFAAAPTTTALLPIAVFNPPVDNR